MSNLADTLISGLIGTLFTFFIVFLFAGTYYLLVKLPKKLDERARKKEIEERHKQFEEFCKMNAERIKQGKEPLIV